MVTPPKANFKISFLLVVISLISFAYLTKLVLEGGTHNFDQSFSVLLYGLRNPLLTQVMNLATLIGDLPSDTLITIFIFLALLKKHKTEALTFSILMITSGILDYLLKIFFHLPRPEISPMEVETSYTYPSGHAMGNFVLYSLITYFVFKYSNSRKLRTVTAVLSSLMILLIGFSRIYLGVHYPSDVLGGYLAGLFLLSIVLLASKVVRSGKS